MRTIKDLLTIARKELGSTESPAGSNRTKYGKWFGLDGQPWCMMFIMWCFEQAGVKLPRRTGSCGDLMRAAQAAGCWVVRDFQPGDVVIYDFSGKQKTTQHCGIVEVILPDYGVQAIEGNTSERGSQDNGGMVCRKTRAGKYIIGAVRPQFDEERKEEDDMDYYKTLNDVPGHYRTAVQKAVSKGALKGTGGNEINVSEDLCRTLTILDRLGKLD
ncbi:MAG: CHAP domain-containing protein [Oscillibacter sp.]|nr:CHAP domain-containing protein [Oscillibacter sp.]